MIVDSNNKHIEEEKDKYSDQREQEGKNKGKMTQKSEKNYFY